MKTSLLTILTAVAFVSANSGTAETLLTDDFTVTQAATLDPNFEIENRQSGSLADSFYFISNQNSNFGVQLGNTVTDVGHPGFPDNGNFLLLADDCGVQNSMLIDEVLAAGKALSFVFDLYVMPQFSDQSVWNSFTLRASGNSFPIAGLGEFGMLRRANGGFQFFTNGAFITELPEGTSLGSLFSVTFSDLAGTGSPFDGNGSKVTILNEGVLIYEYEFAEDNQLSTSGLFFGFNTIRGAVGGVDNLVVSTVEPVPEPATIGFLTLGGLVLVVSMRRKVREN